MSWRGRIFRILAGGGTAGLLLVLAACGSTNTANNASPSSGASGSTGGANASPVAAVGTAAPYGSVAAQASPPPGAQAITEVATEDKYSQPQITVKANQPVALTLTNQGQAVHNWHLLDATDVSGKVVKTSLLDPGKSEMIVFTIATPGTYHVQCDAHPADMKGTLVVQ